ncbi:uncharacterized protein MYCFIDRAFT_171166 [Pseudocercospora fijiensis CIRAD86]|uniref:Clr5 domain-containing protein n=1 Tax=Pseudocercospora fijiensis (strain CIRAD86) TaxID=383855 RepID=N1QA62_PSEFD|nr:uncharacterized protein MYCFIDRAFT_171166 [Pseudocercospora fijiensis CIRAD86]EME89769.1 hypothetical protein MYCFIDRAFT_171166 [Pseudocercospora fijiensis CIRAD86]
MPGNHSRLGFVLLRWHQRSAGTSRWQYRRRSDHEVVILSSTTRASESPSSVLCLGTGNRAEMIEDLQFEISQTAAAGSQLAPTAMDQSSSTLMIPSGDDLLPSAHGVSLWYAGQPMLGSTVSGHWDIPPTWIGGDHNGTDIHTTLKFKDCHAFPHRHAHQPNRKKSTIPDTIWAQLMPTVAYLYELLTLEDLQRCMSICGFTASFRKNQYKSVLGQWKVTKKKRTRRWKRRLEPGTSLLLFPNHSTSGPSEIQPSMPDTFRRRAMVLGNAANFIPKPPHRMVRLYLTELPSETGQSFPTNAKLLQCFFRRHRATNPSHEKVRSTRQFFYILHEISEKLLEAACLADPSSLPSFWSICSAIEAIFARAKTTGSFHRSRNHISRAINKFKVSKEVERQMRAKAQEKKAEAATRYALTLSKFLPTIQQGAQQHGTAHPWALIVTHLCYMPSDERRDTLRLAHELTVQTFETFLKPHDPFLLHSAVQYAKSWEKKELKSTSLLERYRRMDDLYNKATDLPDEFRLSRLYEYAFASWNHSKDERLKLELGKRLYWLSNRMLPSTEPIQHNTVSKAIFLATTMLSTEFIKKAASEGVRVLERAIERFQEGDADCRAQAVLLSKQLVALHFRCKDFKAVSKERTRLVQIRESLPFFMPVE